MSRTASRSRHPRYAALHLKAALSGVSVAPVTAERFDTPADFGSLAVIGWGLGSAGFVVYDDAASMPRVAQVNRCYLPAEGAAIVPGLLSRFALEFEQQVRDPGPVG